MDMTWSVTLREEHPLQVFENKVTSSGKYLNLRCEQFRILDNKTRGDLLIQVSYMFSRHTEENIAGNAKLHLMEYILRIRGG
jgi:hypothetical protein